MNFEFLEFRRRVSEGKKTTSTLSALSTFPLFFPSLTLRATYGKFFCFFPPSLSFEEARFRCLLDDDGAIEPVRQLERLPAPDADC